MTITQHNTDNTYHMILALATCQILSEVFFLNIVFNARFAFQLVLCDINFFDSLLLHLLNQECGITWEMYSAQYLAPPTCSVRVRSDYSNLWRGQSWSL